MREVGPGLLVLGLAIAAASGQDLPIGAGDLRPADILVSTTDDPLSATIRERTGSPVSHALLYAGVLDGQPTVVEAVEAGVVRRSLQEFLDRSPLAIAFRDPGLDDDAAHRVVDYALGRVGRPFNLWGLVHHPRFGLATDPGAAVEIDLGSDGDSFFCSELVTRAYREAGAPLCEQPPAWTTPADIIELHVRTRLVYIGHLKGAGD